MIPAVENIMQEYDALPQPAREEVLTEMLRRAALQPHNLPNDDDLVAAADRLFQELDRREQEP
jgi:FixJ family two-component response regulator